MRTLSAPIVSALNAPLVRLVQLVILGFSPTPIGLNSSNWDIDYGGVTYKGAAGLGSVTMIQDSPGEIQGLRFKLAGIDSAYIALALDDANIVQGTVVGVRTAILDSSNQIIDAPLEWVGRLDTMSIEEDGETCAITATAESSAVDLLRGIALTYSDADQKSISSTDRSFEFVLSQANTPIVWPSKLWYQAVGPTR